MAYCGAPTLACLLLLLCLAALYAGVSSMENEENSVESNMIIRIPRGVKSRKKTGGNTSNKREDKESSSLATQAPRTNVGKKRRPKDKKGPIEKAEKRPRPGGNKDDLPAGVNRQMMRLAEKIHSASNPFANQLFHTLTATSPRHMVISPFSIHTALTMAMYGARGQTEKEMSIVLGHRQARLRKKKPHKGYKALLSSLQYGHNNFTFYSANAVFVKPGIPLEDSFRQGLIQMYNATFDSFQMQNPQGPEAPINAWVSEMTRNKIPDIIPKGTITDYTALIIINAVYFNSSWSTPFSKHLSKPDKFNAIGGGSHLVDMMCSYNQYGYANHYNTEVIELLYNGGRLAMYILLPNIASNLTQLHQFLASSKQAPNPLDKLLENLKKESLELYLPKFKIETSLDLTQNLKDLGMTRAFQIGQADFTGISTSGELRISAVLHKAYIDVNEQGAEAAASTAVIMNVRSSIVIARPKLVKVDRPFMFIILDKDMKQNFFQGEYTGSESP